MVVRILLSNFDATPIYKSAQLDQDAVLIRSNESEPLRLSGTHDQIEGESQDILARAYDEAEQILAEARLEAQGLIDLAYEKSQAIESSAFEKGLSQGEKQGQMALSEVSEYMHQVLKETQADRERTLSAVEGEVIELVLKIVQQILNIEPIINESVLIQVVKRALKELGQKVDIVIYTHPEDLELLHFSLNQIKDLALEIVLEADESIQPGGCRVCSVAGDIDAEIDRQFQEISGQFLKQSRSV